MALIQSIPLERTIPSRHREAEARGRRMARPLRLATRIFDPLDEQLLDRLGRALVEQDELGAQLAQAIRTRAVSRRQFAEALGGTIGDETPAILRAFVEHARKTPAWVDWDLVDRGAKVGSRIGATAGDVLQGLSLVGGFRLGGPAELLVATGGLSGDQTLRRLTETQHWTLGLLEPGALRPGGRAWQETLHVRLMHAMVNETFTDQWDVDRWGLPINQNDQAGTLGLFDGALLLGSRALGIYISRADAHAILHLWKYVGWLLGIDDDFLTDIERERQWINLHILHSAPAQTEAGQQLARSVLEAEWQRGYAGRSASTRAVARRYTRERKLSLWTYLLGVRGMRSLGLPVRPPWAAGPAIATNVLMHSVVGRLPGGKDRLLKRGRRQQEALQASYRGAGHSAAVGSLPTNEGRYA